MDSSRDRARPDRDHGGMPAPRGTLAKLVATTIMAAGMSGADAEAGERARVIGQGRDPQVAVSDRGDTIVVWQRGRNRRPTVRAATRGRRGGWTRPVTIGRGGVGLRLAIDAAGRATAVWTTARGSSSGSIFAATWERGRWSEPEVLAPVPARPSDFGFTVVPRLAVNPRGDAAVVWATLAPGKFEYVQAVTRSRGGGWSAPATIGQTVTRPDVAVSDGGETTVVWTTDLALDGTGKVRAATRPHDGNWSAPEVVADGTPAPEESFGIAYVAAGGDGVVTAAWRREAVDEQFDIAAVARPAGGPWSAPVALGAAWRSSPVRVVARGSRAVAVWQDDPDPISGDGLQRLQAAGRDASGRWTAAETVMSVRPFGFVSPDVAANARGDAVALALAPYELEDHPDIYGNRVRIAARSSGGAWRRPVTLYRLPRRHLLTYCTRARVAINATGEVAAAWDCAYGTRRDVLARHLRLTEAP